MPRDRLRRVCLAPCPSNADHHDLPDPEGLVDAKDSEPLQIAAREPGRHRLHLDDFGLVDRVGRPRALWRRNRPPARPEDLVRDPTERDQEAVSVSHHPTASRRVPDTRPRCRWTEAYAPGVPRLHLSRIEDCALEPDRGLRRAWTSPEPLAGTRARSPRSPRTGRRDYLQLNQHRASLVLTSDTL